MEKLSQVKVVRDLDRGVSEDKDIFSGTARGLGSIRTWWDAKSAMEVSDNIVLNKTRGEMYMDFSDDVWLKDIFGQGDGQLDLNMQWSNAGSRS